jgi:hypothetical protein
MQVLQLHRAVLRYVGPEVYLHWPQAVALDFLGVVASKPKHTPRDIRLGSKVGALPESDVPQITS